MPSVFTVVRPFALLLVLCFIVGCSEPAPEPVTNDQESMIDRNTPLNEEVDEVAKVRDEVLEKSPR